MVAPSPVILSLSPDTDLVGESVTNSDVLTLSGTAVPDSVVSLFEATTLLGTTSVGQSGAWTFETGTLANGTHTFTATDTDAGTTSAASADLAVTVDAPEITQLSGYGAVPNGGLTADDILTLNGTAEAGSTVTVLDGSQSLGTVTVNGSGAWVFTTGQLGEGAHDFSVMDRDIAGNVSAASAPVHATVETLSGGAPASIGVNMEGAEYSWGSFPTLANLENVKSEGVDLVRLPISWEMMQPTLNGPLSTTYLAGLEKFLSNAAALGMQVIVDLHNYGTYNLNWAADAAANYGIVAPDQSDASVLGSAAVPISAFANLWQQLATALAGNPAVAGYDIMNEPNHMPSPQTWPNAAQAAVSAIRSVDMNTPITVEGDDWATAASWQANNGNLHIVDPANDIIYEAHQYFDGNFSGQYTQSYAQQGATPNTGAQDVAPFLQWLQANNYNGFVGELGVPSNGPQWTTVLNNTLNTLQADGVSATVWNYEAAQPTDPSWWVTQIESAASGNLNIAPINGQISPEMALIFEHSAPVISSFSPNNGTVGDVAAASVLTLTGIGAGNATVKVYDGATLLGTTTASVNGAWSFTTGTLANGAHHFTATDMDSSGDLSEVSSALMVTVATAAPAAPTVTSFSPDSGVVGDGITNVNHLTLTGTAAAGSTVEVFDGATAIGTATANGSSAWSFATATLTDGSHAFTGKDMDAAGNVSAASAALTVTIDTVAPGAPTVASFAPDSGVAGDGITNVNHLTLTGTAVAGGTVEVFDGATEIGTATANGSGAWSFATATLTDGSHAFTGKDMDAAGNVSAASAALNVTIDTVAPSTPTIASFSPDSGVVGDGITNVNHITLTGTAVAGGTVEVFDGATAIGTATANASGAWSFATGTLTDGSHAFTGEAMDAAGNVSAASAALNVTIDTIAPNAPDIISDANVSPTALIVTGTADAGTTVSLFEGATLIGTALANAGGSWDIATGPLSAGSHDFVATTTDAAGNVSKVSDVFDPVISAVPSIDVTEVGSNYFLENASTGLGPELQIGGVVVTAGEFGVGGSVWTPIGVAATATGYEVGWKLGSTDEYSVWATDGSGHYTSNLYLPGPGNSSALESLETSFHQDLNGDGTIGPIITVIQTDTNSLGSTSLVEVGSNYFLENASTGLGPELQIGGAAVTAGEFGVGGSVWTPIGVAATATGYEVAWKLGGTSEYSVWATDGSGHYTSNLYLPGPGNSSALEMLETSFHQDLNGDGTIGPTITVIQTDTNSLGSTSLVEVGSNYFLENASTGLGPELQIGGAAVTAGEFGVGGSVWTPIGVAATATGYEVAWKLGGTSEYSVWATDGSGNYTSNLYMPGPGNSSALGLLETSFHQDLNGDGTIGPITTVIQTDTNSLGSTSLVEVGSNYFLENASTGLGPELQIGGAVVTAGEFGVGGSVWTPIGVAATATGYEVAWKLGSTSEYSVWATDGSGHYTANLYMPGPGNSLALGLLETSFHQDLNGDGAIGTSATIATGATLELTAASSVSVQFNGATGTLILDHSSAFAGQISDLTGNGSLSSSNQIDLKDIAFGTGTTVAYTGSSTGGTLTVSDAQVHTANIALAGNYTNSTFSLSSDGSGGTIVIDPPVKQDLAGGTLSFSDTDPTDTHTVAVTPQNGGAGHVGNFTADAVTAANGQDSVGWQFNFDSIPVTNTVSQSYDVTVTDHHADGTNSATMQPVTVTIAGPGNDGFVFHPGVGADVIVNAASSDTIELDGFSTVTSNSQLAALLAEAQAGQPQSLFQSEHGGHDTLINLGNHDSITLTNVHIADLHASNFMVH